MLDDNKYYTPSIEEFHVGFEFEYNPEPEGLNFWGEYQIHSTSDFKPVKDGNTIEQDLKKNLFRVKYLSKEDIESLGWKCVEENNYNNDEYFYKFSIGEKNDAGNRLYLNFHSGYLYDNITEERIDRVLDINIRWQKDSITCEKDLEDSCFIFIGDIKNISELKVLLKQLRIDDKTN